VALLGLRLAAPVISRLFDSLGLSPSARYLLFEAWTARVWPISATVAALLIPAVTALDARSKALSTEPDNGALPRILTTAWRQGALAGLHLGGLGLLWHLAERPIWLALPTLVLVSLPPLLARPRRPRLETLTPLIPAYVGGLAVLLLTRWMGVDVSEYQAYALPDPWSPWFNVPVLLIAGGAWAAILQFRAIWPGRRGETVLPIALMGIAALWLVTTVAIHRTRGVTASDPYCYTQMAIDLAEHGSALHSFPLAGLARELDLPTWPTVHIGYHPPGLDDRAPTMWPIGWPAWLAPFYVLGGLEAVYVAAPLMAALALIATWGLANEVLRPVSPFTRWTAAGLTCLLVATSPEGSERMLVPMADAAAQLFSVLTLWLALRAWRGRSRGKRALYGVLAGLSLGMAYWVRHPQLPLALGALAAALLWPPEQGGTLRAKAELLIAFALGAAAGALPDLIYNRVAFGGWLRSESTEWFLISGSNLGRTFWDLLRYGLLRRQELGYIAPLALYGGWHLWREHRRPALTVFIGVLAVLVFHLLYAALRPRDLIAILPAFYLCAAYGTVRLWQRLERRRALWTWFALLICVLALAARSGQVLAMPWRRDVITFGYVSADQRMGFGELQAMTPQNAVIGSMLNGGAVELYAQRKAVHPAPWTERELVRWTETLLARGRPFYVLDDGEEIPPVLDQLARSYQVRPVGQINLPYFVIGGGNAPHPVWLYAIERLP
jgi:hypothetical protein